MTTITFFQQARADGGMRTGIDVDRETALEWFKEPKGESNPVLLWFIDVRLSGKGLPADGEEARAWLIEAAAELRPVLLGAADELQAGLDEDVIPFEYEAPTAVQGARVRIVCAVHGRVHGLQIAKELRRIAKDWTKLLDKLPAEKAA